MKYAIADLAYAAGIIDGEGCISGTSSITKRMVYIRVSVQQKHPIITDWLYNRFGGMSTRRPDRDNVLGVAGGYVWQLDNRQVFRFLEQVLPYMILKREQALLALEFEKTMPGQGNKKTDETLLHQMMLVERLSELNKGVERDVSGSGEI